MSEVTPISSDATSPTPDRPGTRPRAPVIPDFELIRPIGRGSYGEVWLARGLTGVYRAVKVVWRDRFPNAEPFEREFSGLKKFSAILRPEAGQLALLHIGQNMEAGFFYYVMELADDVATGGEVEPSTYTPLTLREVRLRRGRLPPAECVRLGTELAQAVAGLHARGLVHRDIKPSNVIMVGGVPKLADIGLVASAAEAMSYVGTEGFVPPEGPGQPAADVFALGKIMYELVTGLDRQEFPKLPPEVLPLSDDPLLFELNEIVLRACENNPDRRYATAEAVLVQFASLQAGKSLQRKRRARIAVALVTLAILALAFAGWRQLHHGRLSSVARPPAPVIAEKSVAVLAFANLSDDREQEYFSDGISEELLNALARVPGLKVSARTSAFHFKGKDTPLAEIARQLGVAYIVEGSVRRAGNRVRIGVQLIKTADGFQVWSEDFDRELRDIFAVQDEITKNILAAVKVQLLGASEQPRVAPTNLEAYNLYLRAQALLAARSDSALREAVPLYEAAVKIAPDYAPGWVGLAWANGLLPSYAGSSGTDAQELADRAKDAAQHALALEPDNASALAMRGFVRSWLDWKWQEGIADLSHAAELAPNSAEVLNLQGDLLRMTGEVDRALEVKQRAWQLNPLGESYNADVAYVRLMRREFDQAIALGEATAKIWPQNVDAYTPTILAAGRSGQFELMRRTVEAARQNVRDNPGRLLLLQVNAAVLDHRIGEAQPLLAQAAVLAEKGNASPAHLGYCYLLAGDAAEAAKWLQHAVAVRDPLVNWDVFVDYEVIAANPLTRSILEVPGIRESRELRLRNTRARDAAR